MKILLLLLTSLLSAAALAGSIHKWVDADGRVHFSDRPPQAVSSEELNITTRKPKPVEPAAEVLEGAEEATGPEEEEEKKEPTVYTRITVSAPKQGATVRTNTGQVNISVALQPPLDSEFKHKVAVFVDGKRKGFGQRTSFTAKEVWTGTHTAQAKVTDENGRVLKSSPRITFYVQR